MDKKLLLILIATQTEWDNKKRQTGGQTDKKMEKSNLLKLIDCLAKRWLESDRSGIKSLYTRDKTLGLKNQEL